MSLISDSSWISVKQRILHIVAAGGKYFFSIFDIYEIFLINILTAIALKYNVCVCVSARVREAPASSNNFIKT